MLVAQIARYHSTKPTCRITRAEETLTGERVRADVLRDRLESAQSELRRAQEAAWSCANRMPSGWLGAASGEPGMVGEGGERRGSDSPDIIRYLNCSSDARRRSAVSALIGA